MYETLGDYILESVFKLEVVTTASGKKKATVPELKKPVSAAAPRTIDIIPATSTAPK